MDTGHGLDISSSDLNRFGPGLVMVIRRYSLLFDSANLFCAPDRSDSMPMRIMRQEHEVEPTPKMTLAERMGYGVKGKQIVPRCRW